jgi:hypothetical protein
MVARESILVQVRIQLLSHLAVISLFFWLGYMDSRNLYAPKSSRFPRRKASRNVLASRSKAPGSPWALGICWKLVPKATSGNSAMQGHSAMHGAISCARVFSYAGHSAKHGFSVVIGAIWTCISIGLRSLQNGQSSENHCT